MSGLAEQQQLDRLRKAAQGGVCPVCGRTAQEDAEPQIRSWQNAERVAREERDAARESAIREVVKALEGHVPHGPFWDMQVAADFIEREFGDKR